MAIGDKLAKTTTLVNQITEMRYEKFFGDEPTAPPLLALYRERQHFWYDTVDRINEERIELGV